MWASMPTPATPAESPSQFETLLRATKRLEWCFRYQVSLTLPPLPDNAGRYTMNTGESSRFTRVSPAIPSRM